MSQRKKIKKSTMEQLTLQEELEKEAKPMHWVDIQEKEYMMIDP